MKYHISHSRAFSQIKNIPATMAQQCKKCRQNFQTSEIRLDCLCDGCRTEKRVLENTAFGVPPCEDCGELPCQCRRV